MVDLADISNMQKQLIQIVKDFKAFSIALDERTDSSDTAQCAMSLRSVECNLNISKELLDLIPLMTGWDIFHRLEECTEPWNKLRSLAMDDAPSCVL